MRACKSLQYLHMANKSQNALHHTQCIDNDFCAFFSSECPRNMFPIYVLRKHVLHGTHVSATPVFAFS